MCQQSTAHSNLLIHVSGTKRALVLNKSGEQGGEQFCLAGDIGNAWSHFWLSHKWEYATGIWWVEVKDAAKHRTMHRTALPQGIIGPQKPIVLSLRNCFRGSSHTLSGVGQLVGCIYAEQPECTPPAQPSSQHFWRLRVPGRVLRANKGLNLVTFLSALCDPDLDASLIRVLFSPSYVPLQL